MTGPNHHLPIPASRPPLRVIPGGSGGIEVRVYFIYTPTWAPDPVTAVLVDRPFELGGLPAAASPFLQAIRFLQGTHLGPITAAHIDWIAQQKPAGPDFRYSLHNALACGDYQVEVIETWDEVLHAATHRAAANE